MIVYHGSPTKVDEPDALHAEASLDFGPGFYVTTFRHQAERWAKRKNLRTLKAEKVYVNECLPPSSATSCQAKPSTEARYASLYSGV